MISILEQYLSKWWVQLIFSFLITAIVLMPALSGSRVFGQDATQLFIPQLAFYKEAFSTGESPFWNPHLAVGFPNFVDITHPFAPTVWLAYLLGPVEAHYWTLLTLVALSLFFAIAFLKELGIGPLGALIGGMGYLIFGIWYTLSVFMAVGLFVQIFIFWALLKIYKSSRFKSLTILVLGGSASVGLGWLSIGYWYSVYIFCASLAFAVFLSLRDRKAVKRILVCFFLIWAIGTLIGLFQIIPAYVIAQSSGRSGGLDYEAAQGYAVGLKELLYFFHLTPNVGLEAYLYMGIVPLILFVLSFLSKNPFAKFFRWLFAVALIIAFKGSPLFWLINKLPVFNYFQGAARFLILAALAVAVLVGLGAQNLAEQIRESNVSRLKRWFIGITLAIGGLMVLTLITFWSPAVAVSVSFGGAFLILAYLTFRFFPQKPALLFILVIITAADFIYALRAFYAPREVARLDYDVQPATLGFLRQNPGRILPLFVDDWDDAYFLQWFKKSAPRAEEAEYFFKLLKETYYPNLQLLDGVENLEANEPLMNVSMGRLMALLGTRQLVTAGGEEKLNKIYVTSEVIKEIPGQGSKESTVVIEVTDSSPKVRYELLKERLPLLSFLGIRYALSVFKLEDFGVELPRRVRALKLDIMGTGLPPLPISIYEVPGARPLAYFTKISGFMENSDLAYQAFKESGFRDIFVECGDCEVKELSGEGKVEIILEENGRVKANTSSETEEFMVFTQNYLPGWRAFVDGEESKTYKVNSVFPGIFVPAGEHKVEFVYDYWSLFDPELIFARR